MDNLKAHIKEIHRTITCNYCNVICDSVSIQQHTLSDHNDIQNDSNNQTEKDDSNNQMVRELHARLSNLENKYDEKLHTIISYLNIEKMM